MGENRLAPTPTAVYGFVLLMAAVAYYILERVIVAKEGRGSLLASAVGRDWKGKLSLVIYLVAIPLAFVNSMDRRRTVRVSRGSLVHSRSSDRAATGEAQRVIKEGTECYTQRLGRRALIRR